jgi:thiamine biosynthesis protein ThiS
VIIRINGKIENVAKCLDIAGLIAEKGLVPERIVVERNLKVVPREDWHGIELKENDAIEIISFVGGG